MEDPYCDLMINTGRLVFFTSYFRSPDSPHDGPPWAWPGKPPSSVMSLNDWLSPKSMMLSQYLS